MATDWTRNFGSSLGPTTRGLLGGVGVFGLVGAVSARGSGEFFSALACVHERVWQGEVWRLLTASLLTSPQLTHLLFTLLALYIFCPTLESRWGARRFLFFLAQVSVGSFGVEGLIAQLFPSFGAAVNYGPGILIAALTTAWGRENPTAEIRLFFVLPVKGSSMVFVTLAFAGLGLIYPNDVPEGSVGLIASALLGVALAGSPSPARTAWLKLQLRWLQARGRRVHVPLPLEGSAKRSASHLRAIPGGRDDGGKGPGGRWLN